MQGRRDRIGFRDGSVLFVVGSGRSGTTVLYEILCSDPAAAWVSNYSQRFSVLARLHPSSPDAFKGTASRFAIRPVEGYRLFDRARPPAAGSGGDGVLTSEDLSGAERSALRRAVAHHLSRRGARFFVNKNTRNTRRVGYLAAAFPEARVVHVVRHPVATVGSMLAVPFFDDLSVWWLDGKRVADLVAAGHQREVLASEIWAREVSACESALAELPADAWATVYYEDLVADPDQNLTEVMGLVGRPRSRAIDHQVVARSLKNRNQDTMRRLTAGQLEAIWGVVGDLAVRNGYAQGQPERCTG